MLKKILFFILLFNVVEFKNIVYSQVIPLKKPSQSKEETQKKLLIDTLRPLPKPTIKTEEKILESNVIEIDLRINGRASLKVLDGEIKYGVDEI